MKLATEILKEIRKFGISEFFVHMLSEIGLCDDITYKNMRITYYSMLTEEEKIKELEEWYFRRTNEMLDMKNPKKFNHKIQYLKIHDNSRIKMLLADKFLVRDWVKEKIGEKYLIPLLGVWENYDKIDFSKLPDSFALKTNHGSGMNIIVKDKTEINHRILRKQFNKWMSYTFGWEGMQLQYVNIHKKILAESYIQQEDGKLYDYKIHCFHGEPKMIQIISARKNRNEFYESIYDSEWNDLEFYQKNKGGNISKPQNLEEILNVAKELSKGFVYVRVDLYLIGVQIYFGEMTFTPANGILEWKSDTTNQVLGSWINLEKLGDTIN